MQVNPAVRHENILQLAALLENIPVAMLTTVDDETGRLQSRPMVTQQKPFDGDLWFFTYPTAPETGDVAKDQRVNITYTNREKNLYISITGMATFARDLDMMEEYWHSAVGEWFPKGLDDPELGVLRVQVEEAEYWDGPDNAMQRMVGFMRAFASGDEFNGTENETLTLQ